MKTDLFTKQRERKEMQLGLPNKDKEALRRELQADVDAFLANGGSITTIESEPTKLEKKQARYEAKKKLSAKEIDRRLQEFAKTGKVTIQ